MPARSKALRRAPVKARRTDINVLYCRLAAVLAELFEHPDCPARVHNLFGEAQMEIINESNVQDDVSAARLFLADALAELTELPEEE